MATYTHTHTHDGKELKKKDWQSLEIIRMKKKETIHLMIRLLDASERTNKVLSRLNT